MSTKCLLGFLGEQDLAVTAAEQEGERPRSACS
jgi:hypothetical protein